MGSAGELCGVCDRCWGAMAGMVVLDPAHPLVAAVCGVCAEGTAAAALHPTAPGPAPCLGHGQLGCIRVCHVPAHPPQHRCPRCSGAWEIWRDVGGHWSAQGKRWGGGVWKGLEGKSAMQGGVRGAVQGYWWSGRAREMSRGWGDCGHGGSLQGVRGAQEQERGPRGALGGKGVSWGGCPRQPMGGKICWEG